MKMEEKRSEKWIYCRFYGWDYSKVNGMRMQN